MALCLLRTALFCEASFWTDEKAREKVARPTCFFRSSISSWARFFSVGSEGRREEAVLEEEEPVCIVQLTGAWGGLELGANTEPRVESLVGGYSGRAFDCRSIGLKLPLYVSLKHP